MADLSLVTDNYLPTASETFSDNLSGSIVASAATVPVNSAAEYADGETVVLTVEPGTSNEATFVGKKDTGVNQFIECIWTEGNTAVGHDAGATIIDYDSATHYNLLSKAMQLIMNQDGTLKYDPIATALGLNASAVNGWEVFPYTMSVSSGYNKGNKQQDITVANQDVRTLISKGTKLRYDRGTSVTAQCARFLRASSQYANRASGSLSGTLTTTTDDVTFEAWLYLEGYNNGTGQQIFSRYNGTSGFQFRLGGNGQVEAYGFNGGAGNFRGHSSTHSLIAYKWTHVAITLDMSGYTTATNVIYINGVSVATTLAQAGTNPTAWANAGNLELASTNGGTALFNGRIRDMRMWNAIRTSTQINDNMYNELVGTETNLIFYAKLNGAFTDSTTAANTLSAQGGAVANYADCPFANTQYAVVTDVTYSAPNSTIKVQTPNGGGVPNMTLSSVYYSGQARPYGFTADRSEFDIQFSIRSQVTVTMGAINQWWVASLTKCPLPIGTWKCRWQAALQANSSVSGTRSVFFKFDDNATFSSSSQNIEIARQYNTGHTDTIYTHYVEISKPLILSAATDYYFYGGIDGATGAEQWLLRADQGPALVTLECPYV